MQHSVTLLRQNFCRVELHYKTQPNKLVDLWVRYSKDRGFWVDGTADFHSLPMGVQVKACQQLRLSKPYPVKSTINPR